MRSDNNSYATRVPENGSTAERVEDPGRLDTPDADMRTEESDERLHNPGSSETRHVTAADVAHDQQAEGAGKDDPERSHDDDPERSHDDDPEASHDDDSEGSHDDAPEGSHDDAP